MVMCDARPRSDVPTFSRVSIVNRIVRCIWGVAGLWLVSDTVRADDAIWIGQDSKNRVHVAPLRGDAAKQPLASDGWVVWSVGGRERFAFLKAGQTIPTESPKLGSPLALENVRGSGGAGASSGLMMTTQLAPLSGTAIARDVDSDFLTPPRDGSLLSGTPTFRRKAKETEPKFPAAEATLTIDTGKAKIPVRLSFAAGQETLRWNEIKNLPKELDAGLPAGTHTLALDKGGVGPRRFTVMPIEVRDRLLAPINELAKLVGDPRDPAVVQFALEHLLGPQGEGVQPYLTDVLDRLDDLPKLTDHLAEQRKLVIRYLILPPQDRIGGVSLSSGEAPAPTGVAAIDQARRLLLAGQWSQALDILSEPAWVENADPRIRGLAHLYLAVIQAEGGQTKADEAITGFQHALTLLAKAPAADRLRAHNNFADYLLGLAQDRLHNHAFQMAAGAHGTFAWILNVRETAKQQYLTALQLADDDATRSAIQLNLARLDLLLSDVLRTFDVRNETPDLLRAADDAVETQWKALVPKSPLDRAQAMEFGAMLAFRRGDAKLARERAEKALQLFQNEGFLIGVENAQRILALTATDTAEAIRRLRIALLLSESLRDRVPVDRAGAARAGFFARKAFMYDRLIELLARGGQAEEALRIAELSRSRALQDLLFLSSAEAQTDRSTRPLTAILKDWPRDVAGLEYFLGGEQALAFLVTTEGKVQSFPLKDADGRPVNSRDLVTRVRGFLNGVENQAAKLKDQLISGRGFDHSWQDDLVRFRQELLPAEALAELRKAKTVLVVPHHILHYFPFAALVTERDPVKRDAFTMVSPKYLVDETFHLVNVPSLTTWDVLNRQPVRPLSEVTALAIVDLPGTPRLDGVADDLKNLKAAFGAKVKAVKTERDVTKAAALSLLRRPGVALFAMHGENAPDQPLLSRLMLFPEGKSDGALTAGELYDAQVGADLVVMSACYSGLADRSPLPGDDLFGLQRAFLQAGARTVVAGLWDVYDLTGPELMQRFFASVAKGTPAAESLAVAQRGFLQKLRSTSPGDPFVHPYFWAVYSVAGDPRTGLSK